MPLSARYGTFTCQAAGKAYKKQTGLTGLFFVFAVLLASAFLLRVYQPPGFSPSERMPSVSRTRPFSTISS